MYDLQSIIVSALFFVAVNGEPICSDGWTKYVDEICVKTFEYLSTYEEAQNFCASHEKGSLVIVKDENMQQLLVNVTQDIFDHIWLGSKYDNQSNQFLWTDGSPLTYTNWQVGYPTNITNGDACIEFRPAEMKSVGNTKGQWAHVTCRKRNLVMCQKHATWTLNDAVSEILQLRKIVANGIQEIENINKKLTETTQNLVPIGSIYIEYYGQTSPKILWPSFKWEDISSAYAGLFFRVFGGASAQWGSIQQECASRMSSVQFGVRKTSYPGTMYFPASGWSDYIVVGEHPPPGSNRDYEGLRFHTVQCEVRPENQAIRIWKRTE